MLLGTSVACVPICLDAEISLCAGLSCVLICWNSCVHADVFLARIRKEKKGILEQTSEALTPLI